jgi:hypothetical protein
MEIPKYILKKIDRLNKLLSDAEDLKIDIERWVEKNGGNTLDEEYRDWVVECCIGCHGINSEPLQRYMTHLE